MTRKCEAVAFAILVLIMANVGDGRAADRDASPHSDGDRDRLISRCNGS